MELLSYCISYYTNWNNCFLNILPFEDINSRSKFINDFSYHPSFEKIIELIENNGNKQMKH